MTIPARGPFVAGPMAGPTWIVLGGVGVTHLINDTMQSVLSAIYPILDEEFALDYWQVGLLTFAFMVMASVLQPLVGLYTDRRPWPALLPMGMGATLLGIAVLALGDRYGLLLAGAVLIGIGSSIFHPEASRIARAASGGRFGTAQSVFQVGGNAGHAVGPLLAAFIVAPYGRDSILWFTGGAALGIAMLWALSEWQRRQPVPAARPARGAGAPSLSRRTVVTSLVVLGVLTFSKNAYTASIGSYFTFYAIERFDVSTQNAQLLLFAFLAASAVGVMIGGPIGDRFGALAVIWLSIVGALPFALLLPYANLPVTIALIIVIGIVISSAFPAILVFAQELVPGRVGLINGVFFGLAFGMGGLAAAVLGVVADWRGIEFVYKLCSVLPALGLLTVFLPRGVVGPHRR